MRFETAVSVLSRYANETNSDHDFASGRIIRRTVSFRRDRKGNAYRFRVGLMEVANRFIDLKEAIVSASNYSFRWPGNSPFGLTIKAGLDSDLVPICSLRSIKAITLKECQDPELARDVDASYGENPPCWHSRNGDLAALVWNAAIQADDLDDYNRFPVRPEDLLPIRDLLLEFSPPWIQEYVEEIVT